MAKPVLDMKLIIRNALFKLDVLSDTKHANKKVDDV